MKEEQYKVLFNLENKEVMKQFCMNVKKIKPQDVPYYLEQAQKNEDTCLSLKNYIYFILDNNGKKPDINSENEEERNIALIYQENVDNGLIKDVSNQIITDNMYVFKLQGKVIKEVIDKKYQQEVIKNIIIKKVDFLFKNQRKPLDNSQDEKERFLAEQYKEICMKNLTNEDMTELNKLFNSSKYLMNTTIQYAKNKKLEEKGNEK